MRKKYLIIAIFIGMPLHGIENINLHDSAFEKLRTGYVGAYNPETNSILCTKIRSANGPDSVADIEFHDVKVANCLEVCKGKIIGTFKNMRYNPCQEADEHCESPFFVLSIDQAPMKSEKECSH